MRILVTTPTGNIGSRIVDQLLAAGHSLTVLARDPSKLSDAVRSRATVVQGALDDGAAVATALTDANAAFFLIPPQMTEPNWRAWQESLGATFIAAAKQSKVSRIVLLSSTGAQHEGLGPISGIGAVERALNASLPNVVIVRAGYFMENTFGSLPTIASQGAIYGVVKGDQQQQVVATRDIADVATRWLSDATWTGHHTVGAHGPTTISPNEMAAVVSEVLGRAVQYVPIPAAEFGQALLQAGLPDFVAKGYEEMSGGMATHLAAGDFSQEPQSPASAGKTTFREFAQQSLKPAFAAQLVATV
jgi:uncharacterized protein YbjT (DUF2867 family)